MTLRFYCIGGLWYWFEDRRDVLVAGNSFVYYDHVAKDGQVEVRSICPDVFVVFGVPNHRQDRGGRSPTGRDRPRGNRCSPSGNRRSPPANGSRASGTAIA